MSEIVVKRATNDLQKEARRGAILSAARELFMDSGFFDLSMATIAKKSGLAKGTVYLYFKTKEEIFLALSTEEMNAWLDDLDHQLSEQDKPIDIEAFLSLLLKSTEERELMRRLSSILHLVLEKNITYEQAFSFKHQLMLRLHHTGNLIEKTLAFMEEGQGGYFLTTLHCLVIGWVQMTDHSPVMEKVLEHPDMAPLTFDLQERLFESLGFILTGMETAAMAQR